MLKAYYTYLKELSDLNSILSVLYQDMETNLPEKAIDERSSQIALLSTIYHKKSCSKKFGKIISTLYNQKETLEEKDRRSIELAKKNYDQAILVPAAFVGKFEKLKATSQAIWTQSKLENKFKKFLPYLKKVFVMSKQYALYLLPTGAIYDTFLDHYEEGFTAAEVSTLFDTIKPTIQKLIQHTIQHPKQLLTYSPEDFPKHKVEAFFKELTTNIGFDWTRGNLGEVHHPYEISISSNDIRINTNYSNFIGSLTSVLHELGHGLYEQNIHPSLFYSNLAGGVSMGIHESQSRLLENIISRDKVFLSYLLPLLNKHFPNIQRNIDDLYNHLTRVQQSYIRTEADELTYNMHIIIRFEIEKSLLEGSLAFENLPQARNEKMKEYLNIIPRSDTEGCLQDVHWAEGLIGYFPTYTLGNIISAQLWHYFVKATPDWAHEFSQGNFTSYISRFREHIWQHGCLYSPKDLLFKATGESLNPKYFLDYLSEKYK